VSGTPEVVATRFVQPGVYCDRFAGWISLFLDCFKDPTLIILIIAASISLIVNTIKEPHEVRGVPGVINRGSRP
jgi:hypothetical protein